MNIKSGLPPIHPGEFLRETLEELGTTQAEFARAVGISPMRISHVINGTRPVTAELALQRPAPSEMVLRPQDAG